MNEETLKLNVVVPLLQTIGVDAAGLSFETHFSIQLGHGVYNVKGDKAKSAAGRSDILCRLNNEPLFIIEVKGEDETLTDADKRQGLSYARLLDPMAPFVILTNGRFSKLFDTYSGKEIEPDKGQISLNGYTADIATEMNLRYEALKHFIGYSYENLCHYSRCHNEVALKPFISEELGSGKKYLPNTYISRLEIEKAFKTFLDTSGSTVFPIIGDSGVGKTNLLCHLVHSNPNKPFLFYSGAFLTNSIVQDIASNFNIAFSPQEQAATVLKKMSVLSRAYGEPFVLFLDAIDEWDAPDKLAQLNQLAEWFSQLRLKLVLSCKSQLWERFTSKNGVPTPLSEYLFIDVPILEEYSEDELNNAVKQYSAFFGVAVETTGNYPISRSPFALRVAFEVSQATNSPVNLSNPTRLMLSKYLEHRLLASDDPDKALRFLIEISKSLLERDLNQIDEADIRSDLGMRLDETIPPELFFLDILYRHTNELGRSHIGLYFTTLRDHLIVTHVLRVAENPHALPSATENGLLKKYIGESAFGYFFRTGSRNDQNMCLKLAKEALTRNEFNILPRLLSWHGAWLQRDVAEDCQREIIEGLLACFEASEDNLLLAEQVIDGVESILGDSAESIFTELFAVLLRKPDKPFARVSSKIAHYLAKGSDIEVTNRLVEMAHQALPETGYTRRYIVESLEKRGGFDRRNAFLSLTVDPDPNVRTWVRGWYPTVEDVALRDQLLQMLDDEKSSHIATTLVRALGGSQLHDTGELIYQRVVNGNMDADLLVWACRALAWLEFNGAIPYLMRTVQSSPTSNLAGHALIAIGELHAKESMPLLFELVKLGEIELNENQHWLTYAFHRVAAPQDYVALSQLLEQSNISKSSYLSAILLAGSGNRDWDQLIFGYILDQNVSSRLRNQVFNEWSNAITNQKNHQQDIPTIETTYSVTVSPETIEHLHELYARNDELSALALLLLINISANPMRVSEEIFTKFGALVSDFSLRQILLYRPEKWSELGRLIRDWLHRHIEHENLTPENSGNWFELLKMVADHSTIDVLNRNRQRYVSLFAKQRVDALENYIRKGLNGHHCFDI